MGSIQDVLDRYGVDLEEADVAEQLNRALGSLPSPAAAPLTRDELDYLGRFGDPEAGETVATWDPVLERQRRTARALAAVERTVTDTVGIDQSARILGIDRSRISHRLRDGTLYAFRVGSRRRIPRWQLDGARLLPGLSAVLAAVPAGIHPLDLQALMTTAQDELDGRTPVDHLASGGDPEPVAALVGALGRW